MKKADYGIDAPGVVRNLTIAAVACLGACAIAATGLWSGSIKLGAATLLLSPPLLTIGICCAIMAAWMLYDSLIGKKNLRDKLLSQVLWTGQEQVLDVGCGRGLLLIGAAKKLTTGLATGVDIWNTVDLAGNAQDATLANARAEGVEAKIRLETADMRELPFPDGTFDVILTRAVIHNLPKSEDRKKTLQQIARVLKPDGYLLLDDIRNGSEYRAELSAAGLTCSDISSPISNLAATLLSFGALRPVRLSARKPI